MAEYICSSHKPLSNATLERERDAMTGEIQIHDETVAMELQKPTLPSKMKMTLEQFIDFCDSDKQPHLFVNHLTQDELVEAARSINLMEPARTTLNNDDVSSGAFITMQEVIKDLSDLKWQECCITSLQTLNAVDVDYNQQPLTTTDIATSAATVTSISSNKSKSKRDSSSSYKKKSSPAAVTKRRGKKLPGMEPGSGDDVDGPARCGKVSESVTCKKSKKIKSISSLMP